MSNSYLVPTGECSVYSEETCTGLVYDEGDLCPSCLHMKAVEDGLVPEREVGREVPDSESPGFSSWEDEYPPF